MTSVAADQVAAGTTAAPTRARLRGSPSASSSAHCDRQVRRAPPGRPSSAVGTAPIAAMSARLAAGRLAADVGRRWTSRAGSAGPRPAGRWWRPPARPAAATHGGVVARAEQHRGRSRPSRATIASIRPNSPRSATVPPSRRRHARPASHPDPVGSLARGSPRGRCGRLRPADSTKRGPPWCPGLHPDPDRGRQGGRRGRARSPRSRASPRPRTSPARTT